MCNRGYWCVCVGGWVSGSVYVYVCDVVPVAVLVHACL